MRSQQSIQQAPMLLSSLFLAATARSLASPLPADVPGSPIPSPLCVVAATLAAGQCDPTRTRTIFDILYSCIGVILLCTYISIHYNIPDQHDSWVRVTGIKIQAMLLALLAPEFVIMWALRQRIVAGRIARDNKDRGWTRTHGFFVQMGGLMQRVVHNRVVTYQVACVPSDGAVNWQHVKIPYIPEREIKDHGKGDLLSKSVVVIQTSWFIAQCIARYAQGFAVTEIEVVTLAFATLNVITYGLWWDKPLNVGYPIYFDEGGKRVDGPAIYDRYGLNLNQTGVHFREAFLDFQKLPTWRQIAGIIFLVPLSIVILLFECVLAVFRTLGRMMANADEWKRRTSVHPYYAGRMNGDDEDLAGLGGAIIGTLFGGIHLICWNFQFSTPLERLLWRISSLCLTIIPASIAIAFIICLLFNNKSLQKVLTYILIAPLYIIGAPLYLVARVALLFLAFYTLRALPDLAYQNVRWSEFLPHI